MKKTAILVKVYDEIRNLDNGTAEWALTWTEPLHHLADAIRQIAKIEKAKLPPHLD